MTGFEVELPAWLLDEARRSAGSPRPEAAERLRLVLSWARRNFQEQSGGPFAAAVFRSDTWELVAAGVNRVVPSQCSTAHAEMVTLACAQRFYGHYDLGAAHLPAHELVVSWRPCAMCFGALPWSGIRSLLIAGSGPELEQITGFDEGPIHPQWQRELEQRGIAVREAPEAKSEAVRIFSDFMAAGGLVYNGRQRDPRG